MKMKKLRSDNFENFRKFLRSKNFQLDFQWKISMGIFRFCDLKIFGWSISKCSKNLPSEAFWSIFCPNRSRFSWRTRGESIPNRWERIKRCKPSWKKFLTVCKKKVGESMMKKKRNYIDQGPK